MLAVLVTPLRYKHTHRQKHTLTLVHIDMTRIPCIVKNAAQPAGIVSVSEIHAGAKISDIFLMS